MLQLIQLFLEQDWQVVFGSVSQKNPNSIELSKFGVEEVSLALNNASFDEFIKGLNPTIVLFDRFIMEEQFGWRVAQHCPKAFRILDTEDLHSLRRTRHDVLKQGKEFSKESLLNSEIAKREIASIYRCDLSLIISEYELNLLKDVFQIDSKLMYHLPFLLKEIDIEKQDAWLTFEERSHFVSIGNFLHAPNVDATVQLKNVIWPLIKKQLSDAELHIYGAYPTQQVLEFNNKKDGFYVHGYAENANKVIGNSKVLLAPLRFGAGIKGKLTDAMENGTPSVTTSIGGEGMHSELPWNGFVEDDIEEFVDKAVTLYSDKETWLRAQKNGVEIINQLYDKEKLTSDFLQCIQDGFSDLTGHRTQNFIGNMLAHHSMQSTKYLSKWIEEKNKN
ncbi:MAG: glycosyltransferase family 4 protein [Flavobacteriaceae bacterium]|nr:glycosyltransferase family 4 protein [Flavobacteriaceae bacterium]